eukprot:gene904-207_t
MEARLVAVETGVQDNARKLDSEVQRLETMISSSQPEKEEVAVMVKEAIKVSDSEQKDREARKNNVIIFGVKDHNTSNIEERIEKDAVEIIRVCKETLDVNVEKQQFSKVIRIGKKEENKVRPIIITFKMRTRRRKYL